MLKIIDTFWFTEMGNVIPIGIVVIETPEGERKAYVGTGYGISERHDVEMIAENGAKVYPQVLERLLERLKGN